MGTPIPSIFIMRLLSIPGELGSLTFKLGFSFMTLFVNSIVDLYAFMKSDCDTNTLHEKGNKLKEK